jgi:hypothetical protein
MHPVWARFRETGAHISRHETQMSEVQVRPDGAIVFDLQFLKPGREGGIEWLWQLTFYLSKLISGLHRDTTDTKEIDLI